MEDLGRTSCYDRPFVSALWPDALPYNVWSESWCNVLDERIKLLPRGAVLAVGTLKSCRQVNGDQQPPPEYTYEREFGGYSPGRWMWWIDEIRMLAEPIPARGMQKIWEWTAPSDLEERLLPLAPLRAMESWNPTQRERILRQMIDHEETWLEDIG